MAQPGKQQQKNKKGGLGSLIVLFLILFLPRLIDLLEELDLKLLLRRWRFALRRGAFSDFGSSRMMTLLIVAAAVILVALVAVKVVKKSREERGESASAIHRPDPRTKSFSQPDPYCVVCDHTGEDHFQRDKQQRLRQLDEWLKIGLIDREEYRVLKDRFQRNI